MFLSHIHSVFILIRPTPAILSQTVNSLLKLNRPIDAFAVFYKYRPYLYSYIFDLIAIESPRLLYSGAMIDDSYFSFKNEVALFKHLETDENYFIKLLIGFASILKSNRNILRDSFWSEVYKRGKSSKNSTVCKIVNEIDLLINDPNKFIKNDFKAVVKSEEYITSLSNQRPSHENPFLDNRPDLSNSAIPDEALKIYNNILNYYINHNVDSKNVELLVWLQASDIISFHNSLKDKRLAAGYFRCMNLVSSPRIIATFFRKSLFLSNEYLHVEAATDPAETTLSLLLKHNCENTKYLNINSPYIDYCFTVNSTHGIFAFL